MTHSMGETKPHFTPERIGGQEIWYIAESRKGFTADPSQAAKTPNGLPIAAPGEVMRISGVMMQNIMQLWELLLDLMEEKYNLEEQRDTLANLDSVDPVARWEQYNTEIKEHSMKIQGVIDALAIMEYGWTFKHEPEKARQLVQQSAHARYKLSCEE